ncbi:primosomal protein N' [Shouchella lehensis]|uniref:Replication restart protein PriA n=1 Tax=Shouchella lehensis G1 TaxID=1246626 RepID=A0A060M475_9BACI|nr:primosomal protein N' [Shouchella lehensis]AIC94884.1 primosomal protein N' [Shouchella lehensis G1]
MIARIIVDVPTAQTDRLFDYKVPNEWDTLVQPGIRVVVPFGPRKIQGFVMERTDTSDVKNMKAIIEVLDPVPVLSDELLALGKWLAKATICFQVTAFQAMLPAALKTKVSKKIQVRVEKTELPEQVRILFGNGNQLDWDSLKKGEPSHLLTMKKAIEAGLVEIEYATKAHTKMKTERVVTVSDVSDSELESVQRKAKKQFELIQYLKKKKQPFPSQQAMSETKTSRATLNALLDKGLVREWAQEVYRDPTSNETFNKSEPLLLTPQQQEALHMISRPIEEDRYETILLHGVTGSGKTEIYLQAIAKVLEKGQEAIMLVPEISLTPQMVNRFKARFGNLVAIMHSGLSNGEKYDEWRKIHRKEVSVVVGARSAVFAPFTNLGLLIVDEEHESSYKQEEAPRYHTRDVAKYRGEIHRAPVILGSATPSIESFARAKKGNYTLVSLQERVNARPMPEVEIVDMREELRNGNRSMFSRALLQGIRDRLDRKEQSVLFLNRRGYSTFVMCRDCGYVASCDYCDISYTYHRKGHSLKCHYCGDEKPMPTTCSECGSEHIRFFGSGTQKVEEELYKHFPEATVIRMDVDTTRKKGSHKALLDAFGQGKGDILLGTQMIAKGLDFPNITLVGVLAADSMLHIPDFRSAERTFQVLEQVAGRAGRAELTGEVIVQSYTPEHYSIQLVKQHDYEQFFASEMRIRKQGGYPPYYYMALLTISDQDLATVIKTSGKIAEYLKRTLSKDTVVLGPVVSPIARIKDRYRYQCVIKYKHEPKLYETLETVLNHYQRDTTTKRLSISMDVHPYFFM